MLNYSPEFHPKTPASVDDPHAILHGFIYGLGAGL